MLRALVLSAVLLAAPAIAADQPTPRIVVTGTGTVQTPPDVATIGYTVHGEGETAEQAITALVAKRRTIDGGLARMAGTAASLGGEISVREVRARECNANSYGSPQLSVGACAIIGYTADLPLQIRIRAVNDAATMAGQIGRLGGTNPRVDSFGLSDDGQARQHAIAAALADAKQRAQAIAAGAGIRLGEILSASDSDYGARPDIIVSGSSIAAPPPPPSPAPPAPIAIDAKPRPIETQARVTVSYAIASAG